MSELRSWRMASMTKRRVTRGSLKPSMRGEVSQRRMMNQHQRNRTKRWNSKKWKNHGRCRTINPKRVASLLIWTTVRKTSIWALFQHGKTAVLSQTRRWEDLARSPAGSVTNFMRSMWTTQPSKMEQRVSVQSLVMTSIWKQILKSVR